MNAANTLYNRKTLQLFFLNRVLLLFVLQQTLICDHLRAISVHPRLKSPVSQITRLIPIPRRLSYNPA